MSGTVIYLFDAPSDTQSEATKASQTHVLHSAADLRGLEEEVTHVTRERDGIARKHQYTEPYPGTSASTERIYPHVFDEQATAGQARINILTALNDAKLALEAFGDADITSLSSRMSLIATTMSETHRLTGFNESLGAIVSYTRRAILAAPITDITRSALNALVQVLHSVSENPMIDLEDAAELVEVLSSQGWRGELDFADTLIAALLDDLPADSDENTQIRLFEEQHVEQT